MDRLLARLAVKHGYATEAQVRECVSLLRGSAGDPDEQLARLMASRGYLRPDALHRLRRELSLLRRRQAEQAFARHCVERGVVGREPARALLQQLQEEGYRRGFGDLLIERGQLDPARRDALLRELEQEDPGYASSVGEGYAPPQAPPQPPQAPRRPGPSAAETPTWPIGTSADELKESPQAPRSPRAPAPARRTKLLQRHGRVDEPDEPVERTMQLDAPPFADDEPDEPVERTMQLDAPPFADDEPEPVERTMQLDAPPFADDEPDEPVERTMQLDPPRFDGSLLPETPFSERPGETPFRPTHGSPAEAILSTQALPQLEMPQPGSTEAWPPVAAVDPGPARGGDTDVVLNAPPIPLPGMSSPDSLASESDTDLLLDAKPLPLPGQDTGSNPRQTLRGAPPAYPPPAITGVDVNAQTLPIPRPSFPPGPGSTPELDPNARTMPIPKPSFPPHPGPPSLGSSSAGSTAELDPNAATMPIPQPSFPPRLGSPAPGSTPELDPNARTMPIPRPQLGPGPGTRFPAGSGTGSGLEFDRNANTQAIAQPQFPPPGSERFRTPGQDVDMNAATLPIPKPSFPPRGSVPGLTLRASDPNETLAERGGLSDTHPDPATLEGDLSGQLLNNRYRIESRLGQGGMGVVYRAEHTLMGRTVAIKVLNTDVVKSGDEAVGRFKREIMAMAKFQHPNVVRVFDAGLTQGGRLYMAMEFVEGRSLAQELARVGRIELSRFAAYFAQILMGVAYGHERGIVHRDLKAENVLITNASGADDEVVKIMDFGIAKLLRSADESAPQSASNMFLTTERMAIGTPEYMSPEQASGGAKVDHRSDLYSLGVVAFEMLTGRLPFEADSPVGYIGKHIIDPPLTFAEAAPGQSFPPQLEGFVKRALEKDPADRFDSAGAMLDALVAALPAAEAARVRGLGSGGFVGVAAPAEQTTDQVPLDLPPAGGDASDPSGSSTPALKHSGNQALVQKALVGMCGLMGLLILLIVLALVLRRPSLEKQMEELRPQVAEALEAGNFADALGLVRPLVEGLDPEDAAPAQAWLGELERGQEARARQHQAHEAACQAGARCLQERAAGRRGAAEEALGKLRHALEARDTALDALRELGLEQLARTEPPLPNDEAIEASLAPLEEIRVARGLMGADPPDFPAAIERLKGALEFPDVTGDLAALIRGLIDDAQARHSLQRARRVLDRPAVTSADLNAVGRLLDEAQRLVQSVPLPELEGRLGDLRTRLGERRSKNRQERARVEVGRLVDAAALEREKGNLARARKRLEDARSKLREAKLPDRWDLDAKLKALDVQEASRTAHAALPAPEDDATPAELEEALAARRAYLEAHPQGWKHDEVQAAIEALEARLATPADDSGREALEAALQTARTALAAEELDAAEAALDEARRLAEAEGLDAAPLEALAGELAAARRRAALAEQLADFVKVGEVFVSRHEVTNLAYYEFCADVLRDAKGEQQLAQVRELWPVHWEWRSARQRRKKLPRGKGQHPVGGVRFASAEAYCAYQSKRLGVTVRLPTEAEWMAAASGGRAQAYPWGDDFDRERAVWQKRPPVVVSGDLAEALGGASPGGLLHMAGNVAEWVSDPWPDPKQGPDTTARILKGGSFASFSPKDLRIDARLRGPLDKAEAAWGLRVVVDPGN